jgi:hypothetical protein
MDHILHRPKEHFPRPIERISKGAPTISNGAYAFKRSIFHVPWSVHQKDNFLFLLEHLPPKGAFSMSHGRSVHQKEHLLFPMENIPSKRGVSTTHGAYIKRSICFFAWSVYIYASYSIFDNYHTAHPDRSTNSAPFNADCIAGIWDSSPSKNVLYIYYLVYCSALYSTVQYI